MTRSLSKVLSAMAAAQAADQQVEMMVRQHWLALENVEKYLNKRLERIASDRTHSFGEVGQYKD